MRHEEEIRRASVRELLERFTLEAVDIETKVDDDTAVVTLRLKRRRSILELAGYVTKREAWHKVLEAVIADLPELELVDNVPDPAAYPDPAGELEAERDDAPRCSYGDCQEAPIVGAYWTGDAEPAFRFCRTHATAEMLEAIDAERQADPDPADELDVEELT
jgi:hypothetical protein